MAQHKLSGGVEDLTFGMGTEQQQRQGAIYVITQIHAGVIPYSATQSITQKIDQVDSVVSSTRTDLTNHKNNLSNPHQVTPEDVGAAPVVHEHIIADVTNLQEELDSKSDIGHQHNVSDVTGLQTDLDAKMDDGDAFLKTEHVVASAGGLDAGKPIVLDNAGKLDPTIAGSGLIFVAMFEPTAGIEYPDDTGYTHGNYWGIKDVDESLGYTFVGGDLAGSTVFNGDAMVIGVDEWGFINIGIDPNIYYPLDGSVAISAPFAGGGQQLKNIAASTEVGDAVSHEQLDDYLPLTGGQINGVVDISADGVGLSVRPVTINAPSYVLGYAKDAVTNSWYVGRGFPDSDGITLGNFINGEPLDLHTIGGGAITANGEVIWDAGNFDPSGYLPLTGGTIDGQLTIEKDGAALIIQGKAGGSGSYIIGRAEDNIAQSWYIGRGSISNTVSFANYIAGESLNLNTNGGDINANGEVITTDDKLAAGLGNTPRGIAEIGAEGDPNTATDEYIMTSHINSPGTIGVTSFWHIRTQFYTNVDGNRGQVAISYSGDVGIMCVRHRFNDVWSPWSQLSNVVV